MSGLFNGQILTDKLAKLNNSQQSIETLSHWCIFHRNKAKQVVETWDQQFYCSPRDQRVSFLYLANDILQNSRRKGLEFVGEFWKVLPGTLNDVMENGDEFGKNAALRLVDIWEERKVFGSRGQILKEELTARNLDSRNRKVISYKLKQPTGDTLEKLISCYGHVYDGSVGEDALFGKCQNAISLVEKLEKEIGNDLGNINGSGIVEELQGQHGILGECIEQLKAAEASRSSILSQLREALDEQEFKIDQVRNQLQATQSRYDQVGNMCQQFLSCNTGQSPSKPGVDDAPPTSSGASPGLIPESVVPARDEVQSTPVCNIQQGYHADNFSHSEEVQRRTAAAAVAAKLTASTSSAQMLSYALSSLASEGVIGQSVKEDYPSNSKRVKLDSFVPCMPSQPQPQPPPPPFPHPDSLNQPPPPSSPSMQPPPPPAMLPTMHPPPPPTATQFMQTAGLMAGMSYSYSSPPPLQRPAFPGYQMVGMPAPYPSPMNPYHGFQGTAGVGLFGQPPFSAVPPSVSPNNGERILL